MAKVMMKGRFNPKDVLHSKNVQVDQVCVLFGGLMNLSHLFLDIFVRFCDSKRFKNSSCTNTLNCIEDAFRTRGK